jgi:hypothetical protein
MLLLSSVLAGALGSSVFVQPGSASNGVFDFLDPCIEARDQFADRRDDAFRQLDTLIVNSDKAEATDGYRSEWLKAKKDLLRKYFDSELKPTLQAMRVTDFDTAYSAWFDLQIAQLTPQQLKKLQDANFRFELKKELIQRRAQTSADVANAEGELSRSCKMDVGNQALRVAILGAMRPFTFVAGNWKAAEKDGFIAQVIQAPTGINVPDAVFRCPIRGCSDHSVVNQALKALGF